MPLPKPAACDGCPFRDTGIGFVPPDPVTPRTRLVAWGESPGEEEVAHGRGFAGRSGRLLRGAHHRAKFNVYRPPWDAVPSFPPVGTEDVAYRNVVLCRPPANAFPDHSVVHECIRRHQQEFVQIGPTVPWVAYGTNATQILTGHAISPVEHRGALLPLKHSRGWITTSIHPAFISRVSDKGADEQAKAMVHLTPFLGWDAKRALLAREPNVPRVSWDEPPLAVLAEWEKMPPRTLVSVDIEGADGKPEIVGIAWDPQRARVFPWNPQTLKLIQAVFDRGTPVFHNGAYDVPELELAGVRPPEQWIDTIVMAALYNPSIRKKLETQVLSWVAASIPWKGLVDHDAGWQERPPDVEYWEGLWTDVLTRLGRRVPGNRLEWYAFYNGLDNTYALQLAGSLRSLLAGEGRLEYYKKFLMPLQKPLIDMGRRGLPVDVDRVEFHTRACLRLERMAKGIIDSYIRPARFQEALAAGKAFRQRLRARRVWRQTATVRKYEPELQKALEVARRDWRAAKERAREGFDGDSTTQRQWLLYTFLGLPETRTKRTKGPGTDEDVIDILIRRLTRIDHEKGAAPTIKPKAPWTLADTLRILKALKATKIWATNRRNFLNLPLTPPTEEGRRPRVQTVYSLHRTDTGRLSSGMDTSDPAKGVKKGGGKKKKKKEIQQLQNVPKALRDIYRADPGYAMVGFDWAGIEWALVMYKAGLLPQSRGYHHALLDRFQREELDPHRFLASKAFKRAEAEVQSEQRRLCKGYTYGRLYFGAPGTLGDSMGHSRATAEFVCKAHEEAFRPKIWWTDREALARRLRYVQTTAGWRRWFWEWPPKVTEVYATEIQATAADMMKEVLAVLFPAIKKYPRWEILTTTHDSLLLHVPIEDVPAAKEFGLSLMQKPFEWLDGRTWRAEAKSGPNWKKVS